MTGPAFPRAPLWMCAAIARPLSLLNVSRQVTTPFVPVRVTVALNVPFALPSLPFGFGRSCTARSVVLTVAEIWTWSRISPAGFVGVCTLTYARPFRMASSTSAVIVAVPVTPLVQGAQAR